jgi:hypothetical protein
MFNELRELINFLGVSDYNIYNRYKSITSVENLGNAILTS